MKRRFKKFFSKDQNQSKVSLAITEDRDDFAKNCRELSKSDSIKKITFLGGKITVHHAEILKHELFKSLQKNKSYGQDHIFILNFKCQIDYSAYRVLGQGLNVISNRIPESQWFFLQPAIDAAQKRSVLSRQGYKLKKHVKNYRAIFTINSEVNDCDVTRYIELIFQGVSKRSAPIDQLRFENIKINQEIVELLITESDKYLNESRLFEISSILIRNCEIDIELLKMLDKAFSVLSPDTIITKYNSGQNKLRFNDSKEETILVEDFKSLSFGVESGVDHQGKPASIKQEDFLRTTEYQAKKPQKQLSLKQYLSSHNLKKPEIEKLIKSLKTADPELLNNVVNKDSENRDYNQSSKTLLETSRGEDGNNITKSFLKTLETIKAGGLSEKKRLEITSESDLNVKDCIINALKKVIKDYSLELDSAELTPSSSPLRSSARNVEAKKGSRSQ